MVELRKRPAPAAPAPPPKKRAPTKTKEKLPAKAEPENKEGPAVTPGPAKTPVEPAAEPTAVEAPKVGNSISLDGFGGEIETNDGEKTTLAKLVADSKSGVVIFTYPKASTPGCNKPLSSTLLKARH
jgi:thioredoxin-dependent peroxiredoxin